MIVANAGLVAAALISRTYSVLGVAAAALVMIGFFLWLAQLARGKMAA